VIAATIFLLSLGAEVVVAAPALACGSGKNLSMIADIAFIHAIIMVKNTNTVPIPNPINLKPSNIRLVSIKLPLLHDLPYDYTLKMFKKVLKSKYIIPILQFCYNLNF
jgi:hypothetical protein